MIKIQKEAECAIRLLRGESYRKIATDLNMSFSSIANVQSRISGEEQNEQNKKLTKNTLAIKLFSKGRSPLDVCIELDMDQKEVEKSYSSFIRLTGLSEVAEIIEGPSHKIKEFLNFYKFCNEHNIDKDTITYVQEKNRKIPELKLHLEILLAEIRDTEVKSQVAYNTLQNIQNLIQIAETNLNNHHSNINTLKYHIEELKKEESILKEICHNFKNEENYKVFEQRLYEIFHSLISREAFNSPLIVIAFLEVFRNNPIYYQIFNSYYQTFKDDDIKEELKSKQDFIFIQFMGLVQDFSKKLYKIYSNKTISDVYQDYIKRTSASSPVPYY
ncbi:MAG: hypothetical protein ACE5SW_11865 [Nitrososphaeraceae archaeon]